MIQFYCNLSVVNSITHSRVGKTDLNLHLDVFAKILKLGNVRVDIFEHNLLSFDQYAENESYVSASALLHGNDNPTLIENEEVKHFTLISQILA